MVDVFLACTTLEAMVSVKGIFEMVFTFCAFFN